MKTTRFKLDDDEKVPCGQELCPNKAIAIWLNEDGWFTATCKVHDRLDT